MPDFGPYQEWTLSPGALEFTTIGSDGLTYTATLSELTDGLYSLSGRAIVNNLTHRFAGSVPVSNESRFIYQGDGSFLFVNITDVSGISTFGKQTVVNAASLQTEYLAPDGTSYTVDIPYASINRIGKQLILNDTVESNIQYRWVDIGTENLAPGFRFATNQEAINYGLSSAIIRNYRSIVTQIADEGILDENGNPIETITDAANYLARVMASDATYAHIFQLGK